MRLVVIAHNLRAGGSKNVGVNVVKELVRLGDEEDRFLLFLPSLPEYRLVDFGQRSSSVERVYCDHAKGFVARILFERIKIPRHLRDFEPDAILGLGNRGVVSARKVRQVVLVHNPHLVYPTRIFPATTLFERVVLWMKKRHLRKLLPAVDVLCLQTDVMERRVRDSYEFDGRTKLVPNVLPPSVVTLEGERPTVDQLVADEGGISFLCLNRYYPHKGFEFLVQAFARVRTGQPSARLLITIEEDDHPGAKRLLERISPASETGIQNLGRVAAENLPEVYAQADVVVLPSFLESFSANYLEAMASGKPIVTSDLDFAHAVCGDAALYFKPGSVEELARAMSRIAVDEGLRDSLVKRGRARLEELGQHTWTSVAESFLQAVGSHKSDRIGEFG